MSPKPKQPKPKKPSQVAKLTQYKMKFPDRDKSTELYREIRRVLKIREEVLKGLLAKDSDEIKTANIRGALKEVERMQRAIDPRILPVSIDQLEAMAQAAHEFNISVDTDGVK